jgi:uncharacterized SAM-binding protein YcdF (DUF218 family)
MKKFGSEIKAFLLLIAIFAFVFFIDVAAVYYYFHHVKKFIYEQPEKIQTDAGILFFGDYLKNGNDIGPNSKKRAQKTISLYQNEQFDKIICVGGYYFKYWKDKPHYMRNYLINNGIPAQDIIHDSLSFNTITNWREAKKIMKNSGFTSAIAISDPLHIFRISRMVEQENIYFASYSYSFERFSDYRIFYKDVHHEFVSHLISFLLNDRLRNRIVYNYHNIKLTIRKIF